MKRYEKYKDSGFIDIGEIPSSWQVVNFRYLIDILTDFTANGSFGDLAKNVEYLDEGYSRLIRLTDLRANYENVGIFVSEDAHKYLSKSELFGEEVLLANVGAYAGLAWMFNNFQGKATLGPNMFLLRFNSKLNNDFAYISLISEYLHNQLLNKATSSAQPKLNKDDVRSCHFVLPPLQEQTTIATFLDHKTAQIDALIEKKEQLIEKLKTQRLAIINEAVTKGLNPNAPLKDSGIEWLGEIPEHWKEAKVKYVAQINGRIGFKGYTKEDLVNEGEGALTLGAKHIDKDNNLDLSSPEYISWEKYYESPEIMVKVDDVIITQRGSLGKVCHINKPIGEATINPSMVILNNISIQPRYLYFWLCSNRIQSEVSLLQANTAVPMISQFQLENFPVIFPEKDEQNKIVKYLDETLNRFKNIIDKLHDSIEKLKLYRQSLISEAVTGKIDVRDWEITNKN